MPLVFRLKTFPEILANMFATARSLFGPDVDLNVGSAFRTIFEACALQDADQYVQIGKLLDLFSIDTCEGEDLDRRAIDLGSDYFTALRRSPAKTSVVSVQVGDGTQVASSYLDAAVSDGDTTFTVPAGVGTTFAASGSIVLERGTQREEEVVYQRTLDTFTVLYPTTGLVYAHPISAPIIRIATESVLAAGILAGVVACDLLAGTSAGWPLAGTVIFERATLREEKIAFTRVFGSSTLNLLAPTVFPHAIDTSLILSTFGADRLINAGLVCYAPATESSKQVDFRLIGSSILYDGDYVSDYVNAESDLPGLDTRVGSSAISKWTSLPFANATVTNPTAATRGADMEKDEAYRKRLREFIQSLTRATPLAITTLIAGVREETTGQEVVFSQIVEPVAPGSSLLYISDGTTTFQISQEVLTGRDVIISDAETGDARGRLSNYGPFMVLANPLAGRTPRLFVSSLRGDATLVGANFLEDNTLAMVVNAYVGYFLKTDDDQFYEILANTAIRFTLDAGGATPSLGVYSIYDFTANPLEPGVDYQFNEATSDLELTVPLVEHDGLVAASDNAVPTVGAYTYSTGLGALVQRVVNGDPTDFDAYPGLRAAGTKIVVTYPSVVIPLFVIKVVTDRNVSDAQVAPLVKTAVQTYVNSLGIGDNVILSEIIRVVKEIVGITDVVIVTPLTNVVVPSGQIARITETEVTVV